MIGSFLKWNEDWGDKEEDLIRQREKAFELTGKWVDLPALASKPVLDETHTLYLSEFFALSASRTSNGFGLNPIQYMEVLSFLALGMSVIPDSPAEFSEAMRVIDNKYLHLKADKEKSKEKQTTPTPPKATPKSPRKR